MVGAARQTAVATLVLASLAGAIGSSQAASALAQIHLTPGTDTLTVTASVLALADASGISELRVTRRGSAGDITSTQSQAFDLAAGETSITARLAFSMSPGDRLLVEVILRSGDAIISAARVESGGTTNNEMGE